MYRIIKQVLFRLEPENAHNLTVKFLNYSAKYGLLNVLQLLFTHNFNGENNLFEPIEVMGLHFKNRLGLAAGADKNGQAIDGFAAMGFGHIEVGTLTPRPQDGNPLPRQFRLVSEQGLINRNGFNNIGVDAALTNIRAAKFNGVLGINISKNTATSVENSLPDYLYCLDRVYPYASYITINVSSPNSQGLRDLQYGDLLDDLLRNLKLRAAQLETIYQKRVPLVLKIAPDLSEQELFFIADKLLKYKFDGVIATNTSIARDMLADIEFKHEKGGLSGAPISAMAAKQARILSQYLDGKIPLIASGGISSAADAKARLENGAELLQLYTALVYQGPKIVRELIKL